MSLSSFARENSRAKRLMLGWLMVSIPRRRHGEGGDRIRQGLLTALERQYPHFAWRDVSF